LGLDSSAIVASFPEETFTLSYLETSSAFLDTRGYIRSLLPWVDETEALSQEQQKFASTYADTIRDLDVAIFCNEISRKSFDSFLRNSVELSSDKAGHTEMLKEQSAALIYHRLLAHRRGGNRKLAQRDAELIRELGKEPGPHLF
jgi:hypothetical protein